jgi:hypothetical protein
MKKPRVPGVFIGNVSSITDIFKAIAKNRGLTTTDAINATNLIPGRLRSSPCFLDKLTGIWCYDFGEPFVLDDGSLVFGTHMWLPVELLFDVILCANKRLTSIQLTNYLLRLADPSRHEDLLIEFSPILRLSSEVATTYEVEGYGEGSSKVDWLLSPPNSEPILLEVKNRKLDLIDQFQKGEYESKETMPAPTHDTALIFRSLEEKFRPNDAENIIQGAWIRTHLMQEETELQASFLQLDRTRIHFAILGDWKDDVYLLSINSAIKEKLLAIFHIRESKRFVFIRS